MVFENSKISILNSIFINNYANYGSIISLQENDKKISSMSSCTFVNNSGLNSIIDFQNTNLTIKDSNFSNNKNLLFSITFSVLNLININLIDHFCEFKLVGCFLNSKKTSIFLENISVSNVTNVFSDDNFYIEGTYLSMKNSHLSNIISCISAYESTIDILTSEFQNYQQNCILSKKNSYISIKSSNFSNENLQSIKEKIKEYGTIYCENYIEFIVVSSNFSYNKNIIKGSAIHLTHTSIASNFSLTKIENCNFFYNYATESGGAIYIYNQNSSIINNSFISNFAKKGAGLYLENLDTTVLVRSNNFLSNTAEMEGGAIKWSENKPFIEDDNLFKNNSALYGNDIASYPIRLMVQTFNKTDSKENRSLSPFTTDMVTLQNIVSGVEIPYGLKITILDFYDKIVNLDGGLVEIDFYEGSSNESKKDLIITGENPQIVYKGISVIENLKMNHHPNSNITIKVKSTNILKFRPNLINDKLPYELNQNGEYFALMQINFRKCQIGEIFIDQIHL